MSVAWAPGSPRTWSVGSSLAGGWLMAFLGQWIVDRKRGRRICGGPIYFTGFAGKSGDAPPPAAIVPLHTRGALEAFVGVKRLDVSLRLIRNPAAATCRCR